MEKKVISFSLFGDSPKYCVGAIKNAYLAKEIYPEWNAVFFLDESVPKQTIDILSSQAEVRIMDSQNVVCGDKRMVWRFYVAADPTVDRFISRDCDSRLNERESHAVGEWIQSGLPLHVMRDHPHHNCYPILGGMWGGVHGIWDAVIEDCEKWCQAHEWKAGQGDMPLLSHYIWSRFANKCIIHTPETFKVNLPGKDFVGEQFDESDVGRIP